MSLHANLLGNPPPTLLPAEVDARAALTAGTDPTEVAAAHPTSSAVWAALADRAYDQGRVIESYAYARVGYHRGLDALRRAGWTGAGAVPWSHGPNQGFLRALHALGRAAAAIGEDGEARRCADLLAASDPAAAAALDTDTAARRGHDTAARRGHDAAATSEDDTSHDTERDPSQ